MGAVAYGTIESELVSVIASGLGAGYTVTAEREEPLDSRPWVAVYLSRRDASGIQPIAAGGRHRWQLRFSIWCWCFSLDSASAAASARDSLLGSVEQILVSNRKFHSAVLNSWIEGGEFVVTTYTTETPGAQGHVAGGEIALVCEVEVST